MKQKNLSLWLKAIVLLAAACGLILCLWLLPLLGRDLAEQNPELAICYWPWLILLWLCALPCFGALGLGWKIAASIGADRAFTMDNARRLKRVSFLAAGDGAFFFGANLVYLLLDMNHPSVVLASVFAALLGGGISVAAAALSHLVRKAAALQEQSDLTI